MSYFHHLNAAVDLVAGHCPQAPSGSRSFVAAAFVLLSKSISWPHTPFVSSNHLMVRLTKASPLQHNMRIHAHVSLHPLHQLNPMKRSWYLARFHLCPPLATGLHQLVQYHEKCNKTTTLMSWQRFASFGMAPFRMRRCFVV